MLYSLALFQLSYPEELLPVDVPNSPSPYHETKRFAVKSHEGTRFKYTIFARKALVLAKKRRGPFHIHVGVFYSIQIESTAADYNQ